MRFGADSNYGPHRNCNLSLDEQRTQVILPHRFCKYDIAQVTGLYAMDFLAGSLSSSGKHGLTHHSEDREKINVLETRVLALRSCRDVKANGWSTKVLDNDLEQVCWEEKSNKRKAPFCLYKREALSAS
ncbi:hypothetical protein K7X08_006308 [Anisodus acutangulus]|uniref:Uncharacterized protein n=1 Tax=Anisodus acutangulus TaxID=402998 RepID=A0A9Q1N160_9SOLA|nr:hypothetical protein K7X08_006308 [Anisodus acutangulus]